MLVMTLTTWRSEALVDARAVATRELDLARVQGVRAVTDLLALLTPDNYAELWPIIAPLVNDTMTMQQEAGRRAMGGYVTVAALAAGLPLAKWALPDQTYMRDGRLPSGMPWGRLIGSQPLAVKHRIDNGMSAVEAVARSRNQMQTIINSQAFSEFREISFDMVTDNFSKPPEGMFEIDKTRAEHMAELDREYDQRIQDLRRRGAIDERLFTRYMRVPEANACPFCTMLATRGAVYYGADTKNTRVYGRQMGFRGRNRFGGNKPYEWKAHNNCRCTMYPVPASKAMSNVVGIDDTYFNEKNSVWRDTRTGREYDLRAVLARKQEIKSQSRAVLAA